MSTISIDNPPWLVSPQHTYTIKHLIQFVLSLCCINLSFLKVKGNLQLHFLYNALSLKQRQLCLSTSIKFY